MRSRPRAAGLVVGLLAVALIPPACDDDEPSATPLRDGFVVVDGTSLVGDPIPIGIAGYVDLEPVLDDGWIATSIVDDADVMSIVEDYLDQAEALGMTHRSERACALYFAVAVCGGFATTIDADEPRSLTVEVVRGWQDDVYSNHVVTTYSTIERSGQYRPPGGEGELTEVPPPQDFPPLPDVGEAIGDADELAYDVRIEAGSQLAGPVRLNLGGGIVAILEVTEDPHDVVERYLEALPESFDIASPRVLEVGDAVLTTTYAGEAGGDGLGFTVVERAGRPTWLEITGNHD